MFTFSRHRYMWLYRCTDVYICLLTSLINSFRSLSYSFTLGGEYIFYRCSLVFHFSQLQLVLATLCPLGPYLTESSRLLDKSLFVAITPGFKVAEGVVIVWFNKHTLAQNQSFQILSFVFEKDKDPGDLSRGFNDLLL